MQCTSPKISVLMPAYNHGKYIQAAVDSVLAQTYQNFELIITDDGSPDDTLAQLQKYQENPKIRIFAFEKNKGAVAAMRHCYENALAPYLALLNSDDAWEPQKLEKQLAFLETHPEIGAVFSRVRFIGEEGEPLSLPHFYSHVFDEPNRSRHAWLNFFFRRNCLCHPSMLIRRECYEKVGFYDERFFNLPDHDMWVRLCARFDIHIMEDKFVLFRIRKGELQVSAPNPATVLRLPLELQYLLESFQQIESIEDFKKVFEKESQPFAPSDIRLLPYYLARVALAEPSAPHRCCAFNLLYAFMKDPQNKDLLQKVHGFGINDLYRLSGTVSTHQHYGLRLLLSLFKEELRRRAAFWKNR